MMFDMVIHFICRGNAFWSIIAPTGKVWNQVWADEFNSAAIDANKWNVQHSSNYGSGNHEDACYLKDNVIESGGSLRITAQKQKVSCGGTNPDLSNSTYYFTSGMVTTREQGGSMKYKFTQGYIEARIKAPKGNPYWPAFWLVPTMDRHPDGQIMVNLM
jgi:beta-glucanase (GH16 family)